jgi:hypothetical protein
MGSQFEEGSRNFLAGDATVWLCHISLARVDTLDIEG